MNPIYMLPERRWRLTATTWSIVGRRNLASARERSANPAGLAANAGGNAMPPMLLSRQRRGSSCAASGQPSRIAPRRRSRRRGAFPLRRQARTASHRDVHSPGDRDKAHSNDPGIVPCFSRSRGFAKVNEHNIRLPKEFKRLSGAHVLRSLLGTSPTCWFAGTAMSIRDIVGRSPHSRRGRGGQRAPLAAAAWAGIVPPTALKGSRNDEPSVAGEGCKTKAGPDRFLPMRIFG